jgi:hypothetical protein
MSSRSLLARTRQSRRKSRGPPATGRLERDELPYEDEIRSVEGPRCYPPSVHEEEVLS